jgi:hypothetical protein
MVRSWEGDGGGKESECVGPAAVRAMELPRLPSVSSFGAVLHGPTRQWQYYTVQYCTGTLPSSAGLLLWFGERAQPSAYPLRPAPRRIVFGGLCLGSSIRQEVVDFHGEMVLLLKRQLHGPGQDPQEARQAHEGPAWALCHRARSAVALHYRAHLQARQGL